MTELKKITFGYRPQYAGVRTVVLGATGFIGRWVAKSLCEAGAELLLQARDKTAAKDIFEEYEIDGEIYELNLTDASGVKNLFQTFRPSITFNLAGYGINPAEHFSESAYQINAHLIETVCAAIAETRDSEWTGQEIIHTGTAMEYGSTGGNLVESSLPRPTTLYGKSKLAGTETLTRCCLDYRIKGLTARLFAVYGSGELPVRLLPTLIESARTQESVQLTAGLHKRDFVYVEDVAEGLLRLGAASAQPGEIVNLATGTLTSIRDFTKTAAGVLGISDDKLKFGALPTRLEEMNHKPVTVERLRQLTGWTPQTTIAQGVRKTLSINQKGVIWTSVCAQ